MARLSTTPARRQSEKTPLFALAGPLGRKLIIVELPRRTSICFGLVEAARAYPDGPQHGPRVRGTGHRDIGVIDGLACGKLGLPGVGVWGNRGGGYSGSPQRRYRQNSWGGGGMTVVIFLKAAKV
jgi:hypothetical protein